jgi:hypothetical protein
MSQELAEWRAVLDMCASPFAEMGQVTAGSSGGATELEANNPGDDDDDAECLAPVQALAEEQRSEKGDADAGDGCPEGVADADVEGQQRLAEEVGRDGTAEQGCDGPRAVPEAFGLAGCDGDGDLEDDRDSEVEPLHG